MSSNIEQRTSSGGKDSIIVLEGMVQNTYEDVKGLETIGIGHLLSSAEIESGAIKIEKRIEYREGLTVAEVNDVFEHDLYRFERLISESVKVALNQNQFDALISFSFNIGARAFKTSTLLKMLNDGGYGNVPYQLRRWKFSGGKVIDGLINRRNAEVELWEKPV